MASFSYVIAVALRFEGDIPPAIASAFLIMLPLMLIIRCVCFVTFSVYQTLWRYLGTQELISIIKSVTMGSLLLPIIPYFLELASYPRSVFIIDWFVLIIALGGSRIVFKMTAEHLRKPDRRNIKNVLIIGAEDTGERLVREFIKHPQLGYRPVGFLDKDADKIGLRIHGVKVLGRIGELSQVVRLRKVDEAIIALSKASPDEMKEIVTTLKDLGVTTRILPSSSLLLNADVLPLKLRRVDIADLLRRELVEADLDGIRNYFYEKKVLITGAGGSIGSELAKCIFQNNPSELILIDNSEKNLYEIEFELKNKSPNTIVISHMADVTNEVEIQKIFAEHKPNIVYHAAACKQVPSVELHYAMGIRSNVLGTKIVADMAVEHGVDCFVLISTDKAIHPRSIMGATKRIAELYTQSLKRPGSRFIAVRFGNVFNSNGSVVPLFKKQIEEGGPLTITDPNVERYFMDITEAVYLILQATILGHDSEIFVLDMGKPIRILDLAKDLMQLMGLSPEEIPIQYIGLRPGEKMTEDLELQHESIRPTAHKKIKIWKSNHHISTKELERMIRELEIVLTEGSPRARVLTKLKEMVPEYNYWNIF